jgi:hypothetical protein
MATRQILGAAFLATGFLAGSAAAQDTALLCLNGGHQYKVGDYACIPGCHGRQRYARCDAIATQASWTFISDVCPVALLSPAVPADVSLAPVESAMTPIPFVLAMSAIAPEIAEEIAASSR